MAVSSSKPSGLYHLLYIYSVVANLLLGCTTHRQVSQTRTRPHLRMLLGFGVFPGLEFPLNMDPLLGPER